jgi:hypothetical protein
MSRKNHTSHTISDKQYERFDTVPFIHLSIIYISPGKWSDVPEYPKYVTTLYNFC